jgi:hypothetical protein
MLARSLPHARATGPRQDPISHCGNLPLLLPQLPSLSFNQMGIFLLKATKRPEDENRAAGAA